MISDDEARQIIVDLLWMTDRFVYRSLDGRWHVTCFGEISGDFVKDLIAAGALEKQQRGKDVVYVLSGRT